jgi:hypothetical protein
MPNPEDIERLVSVAADESLRERIRQLQNQINAAQRFRRLFEDLDRCSHGRHEGDSCAGWRGPADQDGGCKGGVSLGNPVAPVGWLMGYGLSGQKVIRVPDREGKFSPESWYQDRPVQ